ncbi:MAG: UPF0280 family protein [Planctomycetaceae bacterium]|nr:UPF0280 family protein [Planctomycetaceae bacterium]
MDASPTRTYRTFVHKEAVVRISCSHYETVTAEIIRQRRILEDYIHRHPAFHKSLVPIEPLENCPEVGLRMARAAAQVGVGPMAAVAGAMAQMAAEAALKAGANEAIIDNGGDIFLKLSSPATIGIYSGPDEKLSRLAFHIQPQDTPLSICSSSGKMGHSLSLGLCDLAVIAARDAALADAAATLAANLVRKKEDVTEAMNKIMEIPGLGGVLIIKDQYVGLAGKLPPLVKSQKGPNPFYA